MGEYRDACKIGCKETCIGLLQVLGLYTILYSIGLTIVHVINSDNRDNDNDCAKHEFKCAVLVSVWILIPILVISTIVFIGFSLFMCIFEDMLKKPEDVNEDVNEDTYVNV